MSENLSTNSKIMRREVDTTMRNEKMAIEETENEMMIIQVIVQPEGRFGGEAEVIFPALS